MLIGEVWLPDAARLARYVGPGELNTVFNFPYLNCPWDAASLRRVIDSTLALADAPADLGAVQPRRRPGRVQVRPFRHRVRPGPAAVLSRAPCRPGPRHATGQGGGAAHHGAARCGLPLPGRRAGARGSPGHPRRTASGPDLGTGPLVPTRGGTAAGCHCRGREPSRRSASRLPALRRDRGCRSPKEWRDLTVAAESANPGSMLSLYRAALRIRRSTLALGEALMTWQPSADRVLAFDRPRPAIVPACAVSLTCRPNPSRSRRT